MEENVNNIIEKLNRSLVNGDQIEALKNYTKLKQLGYSIKLTDIISQQDKLVDENNIKINYKNALLSNMNNHQIHKFTIPKKNKLNLRTITERHMPDLNRSPHSKNRNSFISVLSTSSYFNTESNIQTSSKEPNINSKEDNEFSLFNEQNSLIEMSSKRNSMGFFPFTNKKEDSFSIFQNFDKIEKSEVDTILLDNDKESIFKSQQLRSSNKDVNKKQIREIFNLNFPY
jgi:hypothetical protein